MKQYDTPEERTVKISVVDDLFSFMTMHDKFHDQSYEIICGWFSIHEPATF